MSQILAWLAWAAWVQKILWSGICLNFGMGDMGPQNLGVVSMSQNFGVGGMAKKSQRG